MKVFNVILALVSLSAMVVGFFWFGIDENMIGKISFALGAAFLTYALMHLVPKKRKK